MEIVEPVELSDDELDLVAGGSSVFDLLQIIQQFQMGAVNSTQSYVNSATVTQG